MKMRVSLYSCVTVALLSIYGQTAAQTGSGQRVYGTVVIQAPRNWAGDVIRVTIDNQTYSVVLDPTGKVQLGVSEPHDNDSVAIVVERGPIPNGPGIVWRETVGVYEGSHVSLTLIESGGAGAVVVEEYPGVTWSTSNGESLSAYLNGRRLDLTEHTHGVKPKDQHLLEWRRGANVIVCHTWVTLTGKGEYKYTCDPASGTVIPPPE